MTKTKKVMQSNFSKFQNGYTTRLHISDFVKEKTECIIASSNYWSSTENSQNNSWNVNFSNGNINNNNKYNSNNVRALVEFSEQERIDWLHAYEDCCRTKMVTQQCTFYRFKAEQDLFILASQVKNRTYEPLQSTTFMVTQPKLREIFAANFRDRVLQHWIIMKINPLIEERFHQQGDVSYNCRKGFGTLRATQDLQEGIKKVTNNYLAKAYIGRFDLKSFFMSIDHDILWNKIETFLREKYKGNDIEEVLYALKITIYHKPQFNCRKQGLDLWHFLDESKTLFNVTEKRGMPIGNITSQILANFYMSFFDQEIIDFCKEHNGYYMRFVDDFIIVLPNVKYITYLRNFSKEWLWDELKIKMHTNKAYIQTTDKGVKFIGSVIMPNRIYLSNRTFGGLSSALWTAEKVCSMINKDNMKQFSKSIEHIQSTLNSYLGFTAHKQTYNIKRDLFRRCNNIWQIFDIDYDLSNITIKKGFSNRKEIYDEYRTEIQ